MLSTAHALRPRSRRGNVLILFAVFLTALIGMVAFAIDVGYIALTKAKLQAAADAGALAGAGKLMTVPGQAVDETVVKAEVREFVTHNMAGVTVLEPFQDKGNQAEAAKVAAAVLQAHPDLVGMAGFDSESGPGMGQAIKEAGKSGRLVATCVEAEPQHLRLLKAGVLTACVGQKRELFTYMGVKALHDAVHSPLRFTANDPAAGIVRIPVNYNTGTYTVTRETVDLFLRR